MIESRIKYFHKNPVISGIVDLIIIFIQVLESLYGRQLFEI